MAETIFFFSFLFSILPGEFVNKKVIPSSPNLSDKALKSKLNESPFLSLSRERPSANGCRMCRHDPNERGNTGNGYRKLQPTGLKAVVGAGDLPLSGAVYRESP